jgi:hypothetical protein
MHQSTDHQQTASDVQPPLAALERALAAWRRLGDARPLRRWAVAELDDQGVPIRLGVDSWADAARLLASAARGRAGWPPEVAGRLEGLARVGRAFTRPDGSAMLGEAGPASKPKGRLRSGPGRPFADSITTRDRVLAGFRSGGGRAGPAAWLALDHRGGAGPARIELGAEGVAWFGSRWAADAPEPDMAPTPGRPRWVFQASNEEAEAVEWTFGRGPRRRTSTVVWIPGRRLALLAVEAAGAIASALDLMPGVAATAIEGLRGLALRRGGGRRAVRLLPIGLPASDYPTDRGRLETSGARVTLHHPGAGARAWSPLLVSWDADRDRRATRWRVLTITENRKVCRPGRAFAARVGWAGAEGVVVYRSLAKPVRRVFLGHETTARLLVGTLSAEGRVTPILQIE